MLFFPTPSFSLQEVEKEKQKKHEIVCYERRKKIFTSVVDVAFILWLLSLYSCAPKGSSFFMTHTHTKGRLFFYFYKSRRPLLSFFYLSIHLLNFLSLSLELVVAINGCLFVCFLNFLILPQFLRLIPTPWPPTWKQTNKLLHF